MGAGKGVIRRAQAALGAALTNVDEMVGNNAILTARGTPGTLLVQKAKIAADANVKGKDGVHVFSLKAETSFAEASSERGRKERFVELDYRHGPDAVRAVYKHVELEEAFGALRLNVKQNVKQRAFSIYDRSGEHHRWDVRRDGRAYIVRDENMGSTRTVSVLSADELSDALRCLERMDELVNEFAGLRKEKTYAAQVPRDEVERVEF
jgi:hypothetical protein